MDTNKPKTKKKVLRSKTKRGGRMRQLEAAVHTSLPPRVTGTLRGRLRVSMERGIHWEYSIGPPAPKLCVRLKWWGEDSPGTIFRVPVHRGSTKSKVSGDGTTLAVYQIRSGWPQFKSYIRDMGSLSIHVGLGHMTDESMLIGRAALPNLSTLSPTNPLSIHSPIVNPKGLTMGKINICLSIQPVEQVKMATTFKDSPELIVCPNTNDSTPFTSKISEEQVTTTSREEPAQNSSSEGEADNSDVSIGPQQLEIISELIERGSQLRSEMVESLAKGVTERQHYSPDVDEQGDVTLEPILLTEVDPLPSSDQALHELVCLGLNSGEDSEDDDIIAGLDDISVTESDYPLHDQHLLAKLLYDEEHTSSYPKPSEGVNQNIVRPSSQNLEESDDIDTPKLLTSPSSKPTAQEPRLASKLTTKKEPSSGKTNLSSYLGSGEKSLEGSIVRALGLEKLTELGRVSRARVAVESLSVETGLVHRVLTQRGSKLTTRETRSLFPLSVASTASSLTYFVEYQFPAALNGVSDTRSSSRLPVAHEVMRVASKRTVKNDVSFNHQSVFPVSFNSSVIQRWWNSSLIFRVYCKRISERMPFLVGKAVIPLRSCLSSPSLDLHTRLEVRSSSLTDAVKDHVTDKDPLIGHLQVLLQLVSSDRKGAKTPPLTVPPLTIPPPVVPVESEPPSSTPATKLTEPKPPSQTIVPSPSPLQLLVMIPEAIDLTLPNTDRARDLTQARPCVPNSYIVCKLFCANPHPQTMVQWATPNPQFGFKQVHPLYLTPALLEQVCNNFTVFEVWHKTPGASTDDELLGLVKVSLHQFYLAYCDQQAQQLCSEAKLPVVAMDSYCPVVNPFSGNVAGHLAVLCALGTTEQVGVLQQQYACGSYTLLKPHVVSSFMYNSQVPTDVSVLPGSLHPPSVAHVFEVTVEGVRDLTAFNNTVWGETDCFVQYHFPTQLPPQDQPDSVTLLLQPYRTGTTLCVPNPSFTHSTLHTLTLSHTAPIQQELVRLCGQGRGERGSNGGVTFELWRRFYYPNIRDQLIAKTVMPIVKLCAIVSMQKGPVIENFSLPLRLIAETDVQSAKGGVLDLTVSYKTVLGSEKLPLSSQQQEKINHIQTEEDKSVSSVSEDNDDASSTALCDTEQQTSPPPATEEPAPVPEDVFEARIVVHSALHLQTECSVSSSVYVTLHPHPNVAKVSTGPVSSEQAMIWDHHCVTYIPNMYLQPLCSGLELQVWSRSSVESSQECRLREDSCVGCVSVDLSPLAFGLRQISGWYNVVDFGGQVKGQLKVTVCPTERISYPSRLLSLHLESPPVSFMGSLLERQSREAPPSLPTELVTRPPATESRTASVLYAQLRENIKELDSIHTTLQAKLGEIEKSPPFSQPHSLCQQPHDKNTLSCPTHDDPTVTLPASIDHKTFVSALAQTEGVFPPPPSSNSFPLSSNTTPLTTPPLSPTHSGTLVMPNLPPLHTLFNDVSFSQEECKEKDRYSDSPQEDLVVSEGRSCSLTDVSEDTDLSHHIQLEQFEDGSEQKNKDALNSDTQPLSSPITLTEPSTAEQLPTDVPPITSSLDSTLGDVTTSSTTTTDPRSHPLSEIQQTVTTEKPPLPKPNQNFSQFSQLPNFFMPPAELEESMRRLRASALNRPVPRTRAGQENQSSGSPGGPPTVSTLREVQQYLNSRKIERLSSETKPNVSSSETQRIARIFSSTST